MPHSSAAMAGRLPHWPGRKASARPILPDKEPGAEIYSAATTRDQAKIVFGDAQTMARKDKAMQKYFGLTVQQHVMTVNSTGSVFRPLATEGNVNDGLNLYVAVPGARHHGAYERHRQGHSESLRNLGAYSSPRPHPAGCGPAPWSQAGTGEDQHDLSRCGASIGCSQ